MKFYFELNQRLKSIIDHTVKAKAWNGAYGMSEPKEPNLFLVKDAGVYIMSAAEDRLPDPDKERGHLVAYADGFGPDEFLGGDDYAVDIPAAWFTQPIMPKNTKLVALTLTQDTVEVSYV